MSEGQSDVDLNGGDAEPGHGPGDGPETGSNLLSCTVGLGLAVLLTAASFYTAGTSLIWRPGIPVALLVLAIAQIGVHLVFFLHITTSPDNTNNVLALFFGVLIVALLVAGSIWIMGHLNANMLPMDDVMQMQR